MKTERSEAVDLFRKWSSVGTVIHCQGSLPLMVFSLDAKVLLADDHEVRLISDDTRSQLVLRLRPEMEFGYLDSRQVTGQEAADFEHCLVAYLGPITEEGDTDHLAFAARRKP